MAKDKTIGVEGAAADLTSKGLPAQTSPSKNNGLAARRFAVEIIEDVIKRRLPLDDRLDRLALDKIYSALSPSDRGLTRAIATAAMRRYGTIRKTLADRMPLGIPTRSGRLECILIAGCAQLLVLDTPAHAAPNRWECPAACGLPAFCGWFRNAAAPLSRWPASGHGHWARARCKQY